MAIVTAAANWATCVDAASRAYAPAGRFARHFARGKLTHDPVFEHVIEHGLIAPRSRVLDIGCGQGLLAAVLHSTEALARCGRWPAGWSTAPIGARVIGIEQLPRDVSRARTALGPHAEFVCADMRRVAFPPADAVVLLDVLHYVDRAEQDEVLTRARQALGKGGSLLLRVGDASSPCGFRLARWIDGVVARLRGYRMAPHGDRTLAQWQQRLRALGFDVSAVAMNGAAPFANVLLVAVVGETGGAAGGGAERANA